MTTVGHVDAAVTARPAAEATQTAATEASPRFQELLERLQRLTATQTNAEAVDSPESLRQALRTADEGFVAAMDLRRQLEDAFRKQTT
jgi:hypothetical protein